MENDRITVVRHLHCNRAVVRSTRPDRIQSTGIVPAVIVRLGGPDHGSRRYETDEREHKRESFALPAFPGRSPKQKDRG